MSPAIRKEWDTPARLRHSPRSDADSGHRPSTAGERAAPPPVAGCRFAGIVLFSFSLLHGAHRHTLDRMDGAVRRRRVYAGLDRAGDAGAAPPLKAQTGGTFANIVRAVCASSAICAFKASRPENFRSGRIKSISDTRRWRP